MKATIKLHGPGGVAKIQWTRTFPGRKILPVLVTYEGKLHVLDEEVGQGNYYEIPMEIYLLDPSVKRRG